MYEQNGYNLRELFLFVFHGSIVNLSQISCLMPNIAKILELLYLPYLEILIIFTENHLCQGFVIQFLNFLGQKIIG